MFRPLLTATFCPDKQLLRQHLLDRIAVVASTDVPLSLRQRVAAADAVVRFQDDPRAVHREVAEVQSEARERIVVGRELRRDVVITPEQVRRQTRVLGVRALVEAVR